MDPAPSAPSDSKDKSTEENIQPSNRSSYASPPNYADLYPENFGEVDSPTELLKPNIPNVTKQHASSSYSGHSTSTQRSTFRPQPLVIPRVFQKPPPETGTPTISSDHVSINHDVNVLIAALKRDEKLLKKQFMDILCARTSAQRTEIIRDYQNQTGSELLTQLKEKIKDDDFSKVLYALLTPIPELNLFYLHESLRTLDFNVVCDILCTISNYEINKLKEDHLYKYKISLEKYIESFTTSHLEPLLLEICKCNRDESGVTDREAARIDAFKLEQSGTEIPSFSYNVYKDIFSSRSFPQIRMICEEFTKICKDSIQDRIREKFSSDDKEPYLCIIEFSLNKHNFYANRLKKSMAGLGTNENQLTRIAVMRSDIDLGDIKRSFELITGKTLKSWIEGDTSGFYKQSLCKLIE